METEQICFPAHLGCFTLPQAPPLPSQTDDSADECILSDPALSKAFRNQDPEGCFFCLLDLTDEEG